MQNIAHNIICKDCGSLWITQKVTRKDLGCSCKEFENIYFVEDIDQMQLPFKDWIV